MNRQEAEFFMSGLEDGHDDEQFLVRLKGRELPGFIESYFDSMRAEKRLYADLYKDDLAEQIVEFLLSPIEATESSTNEIIWMDDDD